MTDSSTLFRPFSLGSLTLPNRIVMAPMTRNQSPGNVPGDAVVEYYRRRAAGAANTDGRKNDVARMLDEIINKMGFTLVCVEVDGSLKYKFAKI